jgi:dihydroorotase
MENIKHILIRNAKIIDSNSEYNGQIKDVLIIDGVIKKISNTILFDLPFLEIKTENLHLSPGWLDLHCNICEPGLEHRENINTGLKSAAKGGFTSIVTTPNTSPPVDTKSDILFLIEKSINNIVEIYPTGCITKKLEGKEITEMYDMHIHGAVAFSDGKQSVQNAMLMNIALDYVKNFNGLIMSHSIDAELNQSGQINEGKISTMTGLKPSPEIAEEVGVLRDLSILRYTKSRLHISTISTTASVKYIKQAKKEKLALTTDLAAHQILLSEDNLQDFNSYNKVMPPLRDKKTQDILIQSIIDGTIDAISSDHTPIEEELKNCEFDQAEFGMIGLETVFPIINTVLKDHININQITELISINPRNIINVDIPIIQEDVKANITLFDPILKWTYKKESIESLSKNTPFINYEFTGVVIGIINKGKVSLNQRS